MRRYTNTRLPLPLHVNVYHQLTKYARTSPQRAVTLAMRK